MNNDYSDIEWTDYTFNKWIGCTKVSPACANCYAAVSTRARVLRAAGQETWGKGAERSQTKTQGNPIRWNKKAIAKHFQQVVMRNGDVHRGHMDEIAKLELDMDDIVAVGPVRPRVFCSSLSDWLDDEVPIEWLVDLLDIIRRTPNLDWLMLTKRPENWKSRLCLAYARMLRNFGEPGDEYEASEELASFIKGWLHGTAPANVWMGTTVEDQVRAIERIPLILRVPAKVRFLSCEPLLGPLDLTYPPVMFPNGPQHCCDGRECGCQGQPIDPPLLWGIDWVITGGESGDKARPSHPNWFRSLRDQCRANNVPFLFKQHGEFCPIDARNPMPMDRLDLMRLIRPDGHVLKPEDTIEGSTVIWRAGKKKAGRILDGVLHNDFPKISNQNTPQ